LTIDENFRHHARVRATLRLLHARPGFGAVVLLTLALGIGAPTAVFSVVHAVLLRPLPYPAADRLVQFRMDIRHPQGNAVFDALPATTALQWAADSATLSALALYNDRALTLVTPDGPERLTGVSVTPNLLSLVGVAPARGEAFADETTDPRQIVLSDAVWRRYFGANPAIAGTSAVLDGEPFLVRGVMPPDFAFPHADTAFWVPFVLGPGGGRGMLLPAIARLKPGATVAAVVEEGRRALDDGDRAGQQTLIVRSLRDQLVGDVERVVWIVFAAVGLVSVIATANLALLLLVRGAGRSREFAVRLALGASRSQLLRQLAGEALVLASVGGAIGLGLAAVLLRLLVRTAPASVPRLQEIGLDAPVLAFAVVLTLLTGAVFGALSAGRAIAVDVAHGLGASGGESPLLLKRSPRVRMHVLAAAELACTMILLVAAGVLLRSFLQQALVDHGFNPRGGVVVRVTLPPARYPGSAPRAAFQEQLLARLQQSAGVDAAGLITALPNRQPSGRFDFNATSMPIAHDPLTAQIAGVRMATPGFFAAMGMPLRGREFAATDVSGGEGVVILSEQLARRHFRDGDPIGRMLYSLATGPLRVVGVVADVLPADGSASAPSAYLPLQQSTDVLDWLSTITVVLRGQDADSLLQSARAAVRAIDPDVPVFGARTLSDEVAALVDGPRFVTSVLVAFAIVAWLIAAIGVYGVMAYSAGQRTREVGVRIALGATRSQVIHTMLRDALRVIAAGLVTGAVGAIWLSRLLTGLVHDAPPVGGGTVLTIGALLAGAAWLAAYIPTRRATRLSAAEALRHE
jgi:putative ABC transport system permease protein